MNRMEMIIFYDICKREYNFTKEDILNITKLYKKLVSIKFIKDCGCNDVIQWYKIIKLYYISSN